MSRRMWFISVSVAAHLAVGFLVFVSQVWRVERLGRDHRPLATLAVMMPPPAAAGGGGFHLPEPALTHKPRPRRVVTEVHQRVAPPAPEQPPTTAASDASDPGDGDGPGDGKTPGPGGPGGPGDHGTCMTPPCGDGDPDGDASPPARPQPIQEILVPPVELVRVSGETQIQPDALTHSRMQRAGKTRAIAVFKICITEIGAVASTKLLRSTGYPAYDRRLVSAVRGWRYRPPTRGAHARVCSTVTFQYALH